jgi:hypothetical protein
MPASAGSGCAIDTARSVGLTNTTSAIFAAAAA